VSSSHRTASATVCAGPLSSTRTHNLPQLSGGAWLMLHYLVH
jgi:hypothetical protein